MAISEEARARRYEWRAGLLQFDPGDDRKTADATIFHRAAVLARAVAVARPGFDAAMDELELQQAKAVTAWIKGGREGDRPTLQEATRNDSSVQLFRSARDQFNDYTRSEDYRQAVNRCRLDDWTELSDEELMSV